VKLTAFAAALLVALFTVAPSAAPRDPDVRFDVQPLAPGVYALVHTSTAGWFPLANSLFIVNDDDVMVVDSGGTAAEARQAIEALRRITDKPVRYVINTHEHDDHVGGNSVYRQAYGDVEIIGHLAAVAGAGASGRRVAARQEMAADVEELRRALQIGIDPSGSPLGEDARAAYEADLARVSAMRADGAATPAAPTMPLTDRLTLRRGGRTIEILSFGAGHSPSDIVVYLPDERILAAGDLVTWPVPIVDEDSSIQGWALALAGLRTLEAVAIVPGHGPVLRDMTYLDQMRGLLTDLDREVRAGIAGDGPAGALARWRPVFGGGSPLRTALFQRFVAGRAVAAIRREVAAEGQSARRH
jgi:glyoxylase-like metal-dependent hydrolase (beta-lactamase superfamily II)